MGMGSGHGYASGTNNARKGWAWVGEHGPELMNMRGGEKIMPNSSIGGTVVNNYITVEVRGHALASKGEIGRLVTESVAASQRHGNK